MKNENTEIAPATDNVALAIAAIRNQFGPGSIQELGAAQTLNIDAISTGCISIDYALGVGGLPRGRIIEIYGPESSGKTTFCLSAVGETQRQGGKAAIIDVEHALDPRWARVCGVDVDHLFVSQPDCGEDALTIAETLIRSGGFDLVVVDSVAALVPRAELEGQMGDATVGSQARLMSQAMRRLTAVIARTQCILLFTNQIREKIGVLYGSPEYQPGGRALKFFATIRLDIRRKDPIKAADGAVLGNRTKLKVVKNKVAAPFVETEFDITFSEGISRAGALLDVGLVVGVLEKKGTWISMNGELLGQGRDAAKQLLAQRPELAGQLDLELRQKLFGESLRSEPAKAA